MIAAERYAQLQDVSMYQGIEMIFSGNLTLTV
jgi:hypothetical protein